ncbi:MAG: hypothetical protein IJN92_10040 [Lachnospiraceae bacterium]|nr:hypothetical protein [Lachnospiraceae bacterium]
MQEKRIVLDSLEVKRSEENTVIPGGKSDVLEKKYAFVVDFNHSGKNTAECPERLRQYYERSR